MEPSGSPAGRWVRALVIVGLSAGQAAWNNDWERLRPRSLIYVVLGALQPVALARYQDEVYWSTELPRLHVAVLRSLIAFGIAGWRSSVKTPEPPGRSTG